MKAFPSVLQSVSFSFNVNQDSLITPQPVTNFILPSQSRLLAINWTLITPFAAFDLTKWDLELSLIDSGGLKNIPILYSLNYLNSLLFGTGSVTPGSTGFSSPNELSPIIELIDGGGGAITAGVIMFDILYINYPLLNLVV